MTGRRTAMFLTVPAWVGCTGNQDFPRRPESDALTIDSSDATASDRPDESGGMSLVDSPLPETADENGEASEAMPEMDIGESAAACPVEQTKTTSASAARSSGYTGSDAAYYALYGTPCQTPHDCVTACVSAGGSNTSCVDGSQCLPGVMTDGGTGCAPPPYWLTVAGAVSESGTTTDAAQLVLVSEPYDDALLLTNFGVSLPDDAVITGIQLEIRRATLAGNASDESVRIVRNGAPVGTEHAHGDAWATTLTYADYGGAYDAWGVPWTVEDVRSSGFGIAVTPKYTGPDSGNEHAYVDSARATVFYTQPCE